MIQLVTIGAWLLRQLRAYWPYLLAGAVAIGALWWLYSAIYAAGQADTQKKWDDAVRAAEAKAAADTAALHQAIAEIDTTVNADMEAINAVRVVYRDRVRTVAIAADRPDCAIADSLRGEINAAAAAYAAAASGRGGPAVPAAKPAS